MGKYIVRNVSFEAATVAVAGDDDDDDDGARALDAIRKEGGYVWAENNEQFFNFHNELAYMPADKHEELGYANYAFFCCTKPPAVGGYVYQFLVFHRESAREH